LVFVAAEALDNVELETPEKVGRAARVSSAPRASKFEDKLQMLLQIDYFNHPSRSHHLLKKCIDDGKKSFTLPPPGSSGSSIGVLVDVMAFYIYVADEASAVAHEVKVNAKKGVTLAWVCASVAGLSDLLAK
jgi:hypothetical protein